MKKNYKIFIKASNEVSPAAPASVWGKGVPGKGGATTNYDAKKPESVVGAEIRRNCSRL